ncbi:hypothetical protein FGG08_001953 [Glutinoglossum americanum]|uniref:Uncharacterized protein n=1 Tax=Glutinoglossum americanum TaxID=1670608 RepID=A0A9P8I797_9PEZI|nr:hypothetical protein FGG08_001953 [Glutinoglossum americanum]
MAVHCALTDCFGYVSEALATPLLIQQQHLRKRAFLHSGHISGSVAESAGAPRSRYIYDSISAFVHAFPTRSAAGGSQRVYNPRDSQAISTTRPLKELFTYESTVMPALSMFVKSASILEHPSVFIQDYMKVGGCRVRPGSWVTDQVI